MTDTRWYLRRGEPGSIEIVVEERAKPRRGLIAVWWLFGGSFDYTARHAALRAARDELARRIADATTERPTYDPEET